MDNSESGRVAVMRSAQQDHVGAILATYLDATSSADDRRAAEHAPERRQFHEACRRRIVEGHGGMRRRGARELAPVLAPDGGNTAIDNDQALPRRREFKWQPSAVTIQAP